MIKFTPNCPCCEYHSHTVCGPGLTLNEGIKPLTVGTIGTGLIFDEPQVGAPGETYFKPLTEEQTDLIHETFDDFFKIEQGNDIILPPKKELGMVLTSSPTWAEGYNRAIEDCKLLNKESKSIKQWQSEVHELSKSKGWWPNDGKDRTMTELLMLVSSEVFEAFEEVRNGRLSYYEKDGKPEGIAVELADCIIRCFDMAEHYGWDLEEIIKKKHEYNKTRSWRHNGKKL